MTIATYKDLCLDARDPVLLGEFWGRLLGLELHRQEGGDTYLTGPTPEHTIWVNAVPEPKTVKHRMHIDVNASLRRRGRGARRHGPRRRLVPVDADGRPRGRRVLRVRPRGRDHPAALRDRRRHPGHPRGLPPDRGLVGRRARRAPGRRRARLLLRRPDPRRAVRLPRLRRGAGAQDRQEPDPPRRHHRRRRRPRGRRGHRAPRPGRRDRLDRARRPARQRVLRLHPTDPAPRWSRRAERWRSPSRPADDRSGRQPVVARTSVGARPNSTPLASLPSSTTTATTISTGTMVTVSANG